MRVGELVQLLEHLLLLFREPGFSPSTHTVAHNFLQLQFQGIQHSILTSTGTTQCGAHTYMQAKYTQTKINI